MHSPAGRQPEKKTAPVTRSGLGTQSKREVGYSLTTSAFSITTGETGTFS